MLPHKNWFIRRMKPDRQQAILQSQDAMERQRAAASMA
jgi:hypothetical protein